MWLSLSHHCLSFYLSMFHSLTQSLFISFLSLPPMPLVISSSLWDCLSLFLSFPPLRAFLSFFLSQTLFLCLISPTIVPLSTYLCVALSLPPISPFLPFSFYPFYLSHICLSPYISLSVAFSGPPLAGFYLSLFLSHPVSFDIFSLSYPCLSHSLFLPSLSFSLPFLSLVPSFSPIPISLSPSPSPTHASLFIFLSSQSPSSSLWIALSLSLSLPIFLSHPLYLSFSLSLSLSRSCSSFYHSLSHPCLFFSLPPLSLFLSPSLCDSLCLFFPHLSLSLSLSLSPASIFLEPRSLFLSFSLSHPSLLLFLLLIALFQSASLPSCLSFYLFLSPFLSHSCLSFLSFSLFLSFFLS